MSDERLDIPTAYNLVKFYGDACIPLEGEHDLRGLVAETICRLPEEVQDWLLYETSHVFIGGHGQDGEFFELWVHPSEFKEKFAVLRVIFLSERLMTTPNQAANPPPGPAAAVRGA